MPKISLPRTMNRLHIQSRVCFKLGQGSMPVFVSLNQKFILVSALLNNSSFFRPNSMSSTHEI